MKVRDVLLKDPATAELLNNGVAEIRDIRDESEIRTLRYELETFVCEGQYDQGLSRILHTYLKNLDNPVQPAAWISGFFGSGKSHLAKMLRALWTDFKFSDGATARGIAQLPDAIVEDLRELSTAGKRYGGLHAAAGTLSAGAGDSVRLALLSILFRSAGLPEKYPSARFVLWLRQQAAESEVREYLAKRGKAFDRELANLYVSTALAEGVMATIPNFATKPADALQAIGKQFPLVKDVTNDELYSAIQDTLLHSKALPCTLIVLDEVQQYIGENAQRSIDVQELVEFCSNKFKAKLLIVCTGQMALNSTPLLQRLQARFSVAVSLSDADVETVIRKIVLAKRPDRVAEVNGMLERHSGEIARQLANTRIAPTAADDLFLVSDYPLLPVRRRFWERVLRAVDRPGTAGQLRTQLRVVHDAVRDIGDRPLGWTVPADYLYTGIENDLLMTGALLREIHDDIIAKQRDRTEDGDLRARLCALIFLIGKLPREPGSDDGIRATAETLADLLVEDLNQGSAALRVRIPSLLENLVQKNYLIQVDGEYRLQTKESAAWNQDFQVRYNQLVNDDQRMLHERVTRFQSEALTRLGGIRVAHGKTKVPRKVQLSFGRDTPQPSGQGLPVWVRDGWEDEEKTIVSEARKAGTASPLIFVFIPKQGSEDLRKAVAALISSKDVLDVRPNPTTPEGVEAREAMLTRQRDAETRVRQAMEALFSAAQVYLAGGDQYHGMVHVAVQDAALAALSRLYPEFIDGDDPRWAQVVLRAKAGDGGALESVGYKGDVDKHPVCAAILRELGAGKRGSDLRKRFMSEPYGWSQDTIDGALMVLQLAEQVRVTLNGSTVGPKQLDHAKIGLAEFRTEQIVLTAKQKLDLRKLFQDLKIEWNPGEGANPAPEFIGAALELANAAGGDPPAPAAPAAPRLLEIKGLSGNGQLLELWKERDGIRGSLADWSARKQRLATRQPRWVRLQRLLHFARGLPLAEDVGSQAAAIAAGRQLLVEPDPVPPLCERIVQELRSRLTDQVGDYRAGFDSGMRQLESSDTWAKISGQDRSRILSEAGVARADELRVGTEEEVLQCLEGGSLADWRARTDALPQRFSNALVAAAKLLEPKASRVAIPRATLRSKPEVEAWLASVKSVVLEHLNNGPVIVS